MKGGSTHIQIMPLLFTQTKANVEIDRNSYACSHKHDSGLYWLRMLKALYRLPGNTNRDKNQGYSINQGRKDTYTMVAKGITLVGRSLGLNSSKPSQS